MVTYLNVPYADKDEAKSYGARWDPQEKKWYYTNPSDKEKFSKWAIKERPVFGYSMLSDEQKNFIDMAMSGKNILVDACIGSGKTTAIQVLCNVMTDKSILYLTYNTLLKIDAKEKIHQSNAIVTNYHGFAYMCLKRADIPSGRNDLIQTFNKHKPDLPWNYDVLVLDEYQDIDTEISEMLFHIKSKYPNIQIVAVGDMHQKIYDKTSINVMDFVKKFLGDYELLYFTKCFRLSAAHAKRLGDIWEKPIIGVNNDCKVESMRLLDAIDFISKQDTSDILCLGGRMGYMAQALNSLEHNYPEKFNKGTVYASIQDDDRGMTIPTSNSAIFTTFDSSKGLERDICVVFDFSEEYWAMRTGFPMAKYEILRNIFCVAASRGKKHIIFVENQKEHPLSDDSLGTPYKTNMKFIRPFFVSEMFMFKYQEDIEDCFALLDTKKVREAEKELMVGRESDELIDLAPCIGVYQEAAFFKNYNIDEQLKFAEYMHKDRPKFRIPDNATVADKILYITAYETNYDRYVRQVKTPFVTEEETDEIFGRLRTVFTGNEEVQRDSDFLVNVGDKSIEIDGRCDVIKDNDVYELKFVQELNHQHFLQLGMYLTLFNIEKGFLWNIKNNEMYEVRVPDKDKFLRQAIKTITKGAIIDHKPRKNSKKREMEEVSKEEMPRELSKDIS